MGEEEIYKDLLELAVFLGALWVAGQVCRIIKLSPIIGQILTGIVLGPNVADFVPRFDGEELIEELEAEIEILENSTTERVLVEVEEKEIVNFLVVLGQLGVTLLILESGLHVDFKTLREVGASAFVVAVVGTFLPLFLAMGLVFALSNVIGIDAYPEGLALGAVLAPTSVGIALKLLREAHVLDSKFGQTIVTAAFTDDIFSLVTLTVLLELAAGDLKASSVLIPLGASAGFIALAFAIAAFVVPKFLPSFLTFVKRKLGQNARDYVHLGLMFLVLACYGYLGDLIGSHLLGAFLSGITFSKVPRTHQVWSKEMDVINNWLLAIFFGATVAFAVPVKELISLDAFWQGLVFAIVSGILGKVLSAVFLKKRWVVGWAMVGRGEFAFLVAQTLKATVFVETGDQFLSDKGFSVAIWALLIATLIAPIAFGFVLASQLKKVEDKPGLKNKASSTIPNSTSILNKMSVAKLPNILSNQKRASPRSQWVVEIGAVYQPGLARDVLSVFAEEDIHVLSLVQEGDMDTLLLTMSILVPDPSELSQQTPRVKLLKSVLSMSSKNTGDQPPENEGLRFADSFFAFDIERYIERLGRRLDSLINSNAEIRIERAEITSMQYPQPKRGGVQISTKYKSHQVEEDDDKDSALSGNVEEEDDDEDGI